MGQQPKEGFNRQAEVEQCFYLAKVGWSKADKWSYGIYELKVKGETDLRVKGPFLLPFWWGISLVQSWTRCQDCVQLGMLVKDRNYASGRIPTFCSEPKTIGAHPKAVVSWQQSAWYGKLSETMTGEERYLLVFVVVHSFVGMLFSPVSTTQIGIIESPGDNHETMIHISPKNKASQNDLQ